MYNYFVNESAIGNNTGIDWYNAFTEFSGVINELSSISEASGVNIYLALGNYYADIQRSQTNFSVYGGYVIPDTVTSGNMDTSFPKYYSRVVGKQQLLESGNFLFDGIEFISYGSGYFMIINAVTKLNNCELFVENGIRSDSYSGILYTDHIKAIGNSSGIFALYGLYEDKNSIFSNYETAIYNYSIAPYIENSVFHHCGLGIYNYYYSIVR